MGATIARSGISVHQVMNLKELALANQLSQQCDDLLRGPLDFKKALPLAQQALKIRERILGDLHPSTIKVIKDVGALLLEVGRAEEALPVILREVRSLEGLYGTDSKEYTYGMSLLSRCHEVLGNYPEALKCLENQLLIQLRGDEVGWAALSKISMGRCLHKLGRSEEAIRFLEDARTISKDPEIAAFRGELKAFLELAVIARDLHGKKGLSDLFERIAQAVVQFNEWQERRAPRQLKGIAKIYEEAGLKEISREIEEIVEEIEKKYS
jgi:tetratricopeptide (TPR) repeat protein